MKLLILTQIVDKNDPVLGFFHRWLEEFSTHYTQVTVICLQEGKHALPKNVSVYSLGKENIVSSQQSAVRSKIRYASQFFKLVWRLRNDYDAVFVHMNPEYVVLGGAFWRLWGKRILLWYTHRSVTPWLRGAVFFANAVATAAPESLRLRSPKVHVVGHGIDTQRFVMARNGELHKPPTLVSVGRITPIKRLGLLLDAVAILMRENIEISVSLVGAPAVSSDEQYKRTLETQAARLGILDAIHFLGAVSYEQMLAVYGEHDVSINLAPTGGIDKAVLESMASGLPTLVANRAFEPLLGSDASELLFDPTPAALAARIKTVLLLPSAKRAALSSRLADAARERADVRILVARLRTLFT